MTTATELLHDLMDRGVRLYADDGDIVADADDAILTDDIIAELRLHKAELIELLLTPPIHATPPAATHSADAIRGRLVATCQFGCDRADWQDAPAPQRPGWIRTTCGSCRKFIGYRRADG